MKDLASHIMDIAQNSVRANASHIGIDLSENPVPDILVITITDNGCGMDETTLQKIQDPFFTSRTTRKVGLGIPLLIQNAERTGGTVTITSHPGKGTTVKAIFGLSHLDRPPLGDLAGTISLLIAANPETEFEFGYSSGQGNFHFDTDELKEILEGVPVNDPEIVKGIREIISENLKEVVQA